MGLPSAVEARPFYRAGIRRLEDAEVLLLAKRTTGAVYMAGYTVECLMKALIPANLAGAQRENALRSFRGRRAHDLEWLRYYYRRHVGGSIPRDIARHLSRLASWSTDLRYETTLVKRRFADDFMASVSAIVTWADGRV